MGAREDILTAIRDRGPAPRELPPVPDFSRGGGDLAGLFISALARLDGQAVPSPPAGLQQWLAATFPDATRICSAVPEVTGTVTPDQFPDWAAPADVDVTVVRTPLGVAETGSILLTESELAVTTAAVLARHLVVLLDPADLVENVHLAYRHPSFTRAAYAVLLSGPSGSADIRPAATTPGSCSGTWPRSATRPAPGPAAAGPP